jgi:two-component system chemotaxis response regulator CheB
MTARRVVVVENSPKQRAQVVRALEADVGLTVVGEASDAASAIAVIESTRPDVVTLDLQIPDGGQRVIEHVMGSVPTPILVLSDDVADRQSAAVVDALAAGAVDVLLKPARWTDATERDLRSRVRIVAGVAVIRRRPGHTRPAPRKPAPASAAAASRSRSREVTIVGIGASTGGPAALAEVLGGLAGLDACVVVVQHLHPDFVGGLVSWMDRVSPLRVELASGGERVQAGVAFVAPGGSHVRIGDDDELVLSTEPKSLHCPSVDVLFRSLAARRRGRNVGVLLTGMGDDGATGLLELRKRGDVTIAQDEATSAVYGMPRAGARLGAAVHTLPLDQIASAIVRAAGGMS